MCLKSLFVLNPLPNLKSANFSCSRIFNISIQNKSSFKGGLNLRKVFTLIQITKKWCQITPRSNFFQVNSAQECFGAFFWDLNQNERLSEIKLPFPTIQDEMNKIPTLIFLTRPFKVTFPLGIDNRSESVYLSWTGWCSCPNKGWRHFRNFKS